MTRHLESVIGFNSYKNRSFWYLDDNTKTKLFVFHLYLVRTVWREISIYSAGVYIFNTAVGAPRRTDKTNLPTCCRAAWPGTAYTRDRPAAWWCWTTRTCRKTAWPENRTSVFSAVEGWIVLKSKRNQMNTRYARTNGRRARETPPEFRYYARAYLLYAR